jgi:hypothetical protein
MLHVVSLLVAQAEGRGGLRIVGLLFIVALVLLIIMLFQKVRKG